MALASRRSIHRRQIKNGPRLDVPRGPFQTPPSVLLEQANDCWAANTKISYGERQALEGLLEDAEGAYKKLTQPLYVPVDFRVADTLHSFLSPCLVSDEREEDRRALNQVREGLGKAQTDEDFARSIEAYIELAEVHRETLYYTWGYPESLVKEGEWAIEAMRSQTKPSAQGAKATANLTGPTPTT